jgi:predicted methyltransferase
MRYFVLLPTLFVLVACQSADDGQAESAAADVADSSATVEAPTNTLAAVLAAQPEETRARYQYRHPQETIEFFGIEPGMTVLEGLPGGGWYTKVLLPYLGTDGKVIGGSYAIDMWARFPFASEEFMARQETWVADWPAMAAEWGGDNPGAIGAFHFGSLPAELEGTADLAFFPRVLHNLARFENQGVGDYLSVALADTYKVLKPGGILGIVQHHARDDMPDDWADGSNGYLKKSFVIAQAEAVGFELVGDSDINANPNDQPTTDDIVWRLPPTYGTSGDDAEKRAAMDAIGESNRMTLKFRKPE